MPKAWTVDRKTWYRGKGANLSRLRNENGMMCCLGHRALACGLKPEQIEGLKSPFAIGGAGLAADNWMDFLDPGQKAKFGQSELCYDTMRINDNPVISDYDREHRLTELFGSIGETVTFVD